MKKHFDLQKSPSERFKAIVFSLDSSRPESYFGKLERDLGKQGISGTILLDLLACNGCSSRRFFAVDFDGNKLNLVSFRAEPARGLDDDTVRFCTSFYEKKAPTLHGTVLSVASRRRLSAA